MRVDHLHVYCKALEPTLAFMTGALKGKLVAKRLMGGMPGAELHFDGCAVYLKAVGEEWRAPNLADTLCGYSHLGFVVDDLAETLAEIGARPDARLVGEPFTSGGGMRLCAFVAGPDELYVEFIQNLQ